MAVDIRSTGNVFFGYHTTVFISAKYKISTLNSVDMQFEANSTDTGKSGDSWVTLFNISPSNYNNWKINNYISIWTGPPSLFGKMAAGRITKISTSSGDQDRSITIYFSESANYETIKAPQEKTTKTTGSKKTPKTKSVAVNHSFAKNTKAKTIINWITNKTKIKVARLKLKNNKKYSRGYTLSKPPFKALQDLANDCDSYFYFRRNQLIYDDGKQANPFKEHIYFSIGSGLTAQPTLTSQTKGRNAQSIWTLECWLDPRVAAGSYVQVGSKTLNGFCRVKSVKYRLNDDGYTMEVQVYAK